MSPLFSEPSSGSLLHFQEKKKSQSSYTDLQCPTWSVPGLPLGALLPAHLTAFTFASLWFLECAKP